jgi:transglutaminase-like putative cysteine protease
MTATRAPWLPAWPNWRRLPRETRDTLFLLGVIAWTIAPHAGHLPAWCLALTVTVLLWRARLALTNAALPNRWWLIALLAVAAALTWWTHRSLLGKEPGVTLAVVLMALKTLELRARRDAFVVFFLGFFLVLTHFLYSQSIAVAAAMLVSVWGLLTALVLAHMPVGQPSLARASALAARTALLGAPVMALLFVFFPRVGPLWGVPQDGISTTGLSNSMRLGSVAEVASDDTIAMRVRFIGAVPPASSLYFRGPVLTRFDGAEWRSSGPPVAPAGVPSRPPPATVGSPAIRYEATLEPLRLATVPLLEATLEGPVIEGYTLVARGDLQWIAERPILERVRFEATAHLQAAIGQSRADPGGLFEALELPDGFNPRTLAWARALRAEPAQRGASHAALAELLLQRIRSGGYDYTLAPGTYGRDSVDEFWLDRRQGFCEHFAAAFVVSMRAMGVPARIVTGYQGADLPPVDGYHVVRQSSAHAWAEYWSGGTVGGGAGSSAAGSGRWVRADPTAAVAPDRIRRSSRLLPAPGFVAGAIANVDPQLLSRLRAVWESVDNRWNQWVLQYARNQQLDLLRSLGVRSPSWEDLGIVLLGLLTVLAAAGALWAWLDRHRVDPWVRQAERVRKSLRQAGLVAAAHDSPRTLAARVRGAWSEREAAPLLDLLQSLERQRYGRGALTRPDPALTRAIVAAAARLPRERRATPSNPVLAAR